ncbi:hypothetical protein DPMN_032614 [Dreissena polymorpha]|uniref:Uncharacterized protein n=1 Tax=Dreissena polymorpha TaxID=45954 RepID=A0A9D4RK88_DREPO|nr:hypothetical protein DPMN_032614 [Dreissena polymorpha]
MKEVFSEPQLVAFRMDCNLQDNLVHKKHNMMFFRKPNMSGPCGAQRCAICPYMMKADYFTDPSGRKYSGRNNVDIANHPILCTRSTVVAVAGSCMWERPAELRTSDIY